ncbi:Uncharacterised protein [Acidipropionibacterium jensenii]|uniref:Uncharacterized protein n=1 Tax=Acidipropionibacterium jensenii TaxID=1749 RepID=A0A3S4YWT0_9ACTN|nr:Uncharacterised protein [Acidipropionibacterium jensenii]
MDMDDIGLATLQERSQATYYRRVRDESLTSLAQGGHPQAETSELASRPGFGLHAHQLALVPCTRQQLAFESSMEFCPAILKEIVEDQDFHAFSPTSESCDDRMASPVLP